MLWVPLQGEALRVAGLGQGGSLWAAEHGHVSNLEPGPCDCEDAEIPCPRAPLLRSKRCPPHRFCLFLPAAPRMAQSCLASAANPGPAALPRPPPTAFGSPGAGSGHLAPPPAAMRCHRPQPNAARPQRTQVQPPEGQAQGGGLHGPSLACQGEGRPGGVRGAVPPSSGLTVLSPSSPSCSPYARSSQPPQKRSHLSPRRFVSQPSFPPALSPLPSFPCLGPLAFFACVANPNAVWPLW